MKLELLKEEELNRLKKHYGVYANRLGFSQHKYIYSTNFENYYEKYKAFESKPSDIWVASFPKSGTTWTQEMVWAIANNFDYETANTVFSMKRFPFFEWDSILPEDSSLMVYNDEEDDPCRPGATWKILHNSKNPRTIKTHLHYDLLPSDIEKVGSKIIYVCRDPRDVIVSYYYHSIKLDGYVGTFTEFFDFFMDGLHFYCPFWKNILDFWDNRNKGHILFLRYEELKKDLEGSIKKVAEFIGYNVPETEMPKLSEHLSFEHMSKTPSLNQENIASPSDADRTQPFMRKGKVGDWKAHMTEDQIKRLNEWIEFNLKDSDFPYYRP